jgi:hypothetical protein
MAYADANYEIEPWRPGDPDMSTFLLIDREGDVVTVRMNRPETRNALTDPGQMQEFGNLCDDLRADLTVKLSRWNSTHPPGVIRAGDPDNCGGEWPCDRRRTGSCLHVRHPVGGQERNVC